VLPDIPQMTVRIDGFLLIIGIVYPFIQHAHGGARYRHLGCERRKLIVLTAGVAKESFAFARAIFGLCLPIMRSERNADGDRRAK
jgi:hypothetical protein